MLDMQPIKSEDLPLIQQLGYKYNLELDAAGTDHAAVVRWITATAQKTWEGTHFFWLARLENEVIGFSSCYLAINPFTQKTSGMIEDFYIVPAYRHHGYAQELAHTTFHELASRGAVEIHLDILKNNTTALQFWRRLGLQVHHYAMSMPITNKEA
ncbi:GNAT family N-acetyltransferase [Dictyobacter aurantiacus]|uniref:N-acetyltransferase domain-containing protein n=1 Tax=Dictyobacter aurantiacus TaxID=1936993 RepID=A0A401ZS72_9CHLR|nr:GNAT family N-acetyltransferase [Dictyobacter aurantiacus]GCE09652.1 hypothetical protein KDAU_69810 [Dictyobacter aurantiacus]